MTLYKIKVTFKSGNASRLGEAHDIVGAKAELERIKAIYAHYIPSQAPVKFEIIRCEIGPWEVVE